MTLAAPLALLGLLLIPILLWLDRRRRRPRAMTWPSLVVWGAVAEAAAQRRRSTDPLVWLECAATALLVLAAAGPVVGAGAAERRVIVLTDRGPHMQARRGDGATVAAATEAEVRRILDAVGAAAELQRFDAGPDLAGDAAALPAADVRVVATNRDVSGPGLVIVGRAAYGHNLALHAVRVEGDRLWFAVETDGPARAVRVRVGGRKATVQTGRGQWVPFAETLEILDDDNFDGDDAVRLRPIRLAARDETGSPFVRAALFKAGTPADPGQSPDLVVSGAGGVSVPGLVRGNDCVARGLFDGLFLDECAWRGVRARPGDGLLAHEAGAVAAWLDESTLWLGLPVDRDWDDHGTLALVVERAKQERARALLRAGEVLVGDAAAFPAPGLIDTRGADRPWTGALAAAASGRARGTRLRAALAALAALVLGVYALRR